MLQHKHCMFLEHLQQIAKKYLKIQNWYKGNTFNKKRLGLHHPTNKQIKFQDKSHRFNLIIRN